jgi:CheY-like chemotaxis protein
MNDVQGESIMTNELKRVLVVDDEDDLTWSISKHLAKDKDKYELICVNSGKKALEVLSQVPVELVISDIRMPEISGLELLIKIRDNYPTTKVIIMTAYGSSEIQEEANKHGCLKYIEKPFEINELREFILNVITQKKGFQGTISDFHLSDLIQMNCLGRLTSALNVQMADHAGVVYFIEGNIVHAACDKIEGKEALYEILSWEGGSFTSERGKRSPKETIIEGWQSLLLEGMRRVDESRKNVVSEREEKRLTRAEKINTILDQIMKIKGVVLTVVFDPDGFPVASQVHKKVQDLYRINQLVPVFSNFIKQIESIVSDLQLKQTKDLIIEFEKAVLKLTHIEAKKEYLITLSENKNNLSLLRMETKKQMPNLVQVL